MPVIGFLHTSPVHTPRFDTLVAALAPEYRTVVVVDERLLSEARRVGPGAAQVRKGIADALTELGRAGAGVIVCTCSTIGAEAERAGGEHDVPVVRVDRPMVETAIAVGNRIAVVAAVESTIAPTRELIDSVASSRGAAIDVSVSVSEGAWERFEAGDLDGYLQAVADTCRSLDGLVDVIVLAQASMADAAQRADCRTPILASPHLAVQAAIALAR